MRMFKCDDILLVVNLVILCNWSINLAAALALKSLNFNIKKCKVGTAILQKTSQKLFLINCFLVESSGSQAQALSHLSVTCYYFPCDRRNVNIIMVSNFIIIRCVV